ncbi:MAG TPA: FCD domain-containing protein [Bauldia sp.]|nr:FCD domain-containing protein [Bauldia sp.]
MTRSRKPKAGPATESHNGDRIADLAYRRMETMFVTGEFVPGSMITEGYIGEVLKLGRAPVRDAIKRFEAAGLLRPLHRKGILVAGMDIWEHLHLLEVREPLEVVVVTTAALRATDEERQVFLRCAGMFNEAIVERSREKVIAADFQYKTAMLAATRNQYLRNIIGPIHILSRRFWNMNANYENNPDAMTTVCELHIRINTAVASGDTEAAQHAVREFIAFLRTYVRGVWERGFIEAGQIAAAGRKERRKAPTD